MKYGLWGDIGDMRYGDMGMWDVWDVRYWGCGISDIIYGGYEEMEYEGYGR